MTSCTRPVATHSCLRWMRRRRNKLYAETKDDNDGRSGLARRSQTRSGHECDAEIGKQLGGVPSGPYHGHDGLQRWWDDVADVFEEFQVDAQERSPSTRTAASPCSGSGASATGIDLDAAWAQS